MKHTTGPNEWFVLAIDMNDPSFSSFVIFSSSKHGCAQVVTHYSREYRLKGFRLEMWHSETEAALTALETK